MTLRDDISMFDLGQIAGFAYAARLAVEREDREYLIRDLRDIRDIANGMLDKLGEE